MNLEEIDKWLDNEYGISYTRLEELHDYFFEKYTDQKEEIERLHNIIKEVREYIENKQKLQKMWGPVTLSEDSQKELLDLLDKENK